MQTMSHALVMGRRAPMTAERATGLVFAGLLQVALIWALVEGLNIKVWPEPVTVTKVDILRTKVIPQPPPPPLRGWVKPQEHNLLPPPFQIDDGSKPTGITEHFGATTQQVDFGPAGVGSTHTIPPYPPLAIRLNEFGKVRLHLTITPQGTVTDAAVVRSSGYADLDQAARSWVVAHWRYHPATHAGTPVAGTADAEVQFDLKNAR